MDFSAPAVGFVPSGVVHGFSVEPLGSDAIVMSIADSLLPLEFAKSQTTLALDRPVMITGQETVLLWERLDRVMRLIAEEYADLTAGSERMIPSLAAVALTQIGRLASDAPRLAQSPQQLLASGLRRLVERHFRENWPIRHV